MEIKQSGTLTPALGSSSRPAERKEGSAERGAAEQDAVPPPEGMAKLTNDEIWCFLNGLDPTELARMREVAMRFNLSINNDQHLNNRMQHGKYLRLAKQTADQIQHVVWKSTAYCDIAAALLPR